MSSSTGWGWGAPKEECTRIIEDFADRGGNFIDTANTFQMGLSEEIVGEFLKGDRGFYVLATKHTITSDRRTQTPVATTARADARREAFPGAIADGPYRPLLVAHLGTIRPRSWRSCGPWTTWCTRAKSITLACPIPEPGSRAGRRPSPRGSADAGDLPVAAVLPGGEQHQGRAPAHGAVTRNGRHGLVPAGQRRASRQAQGAEAHLPTDGAMGQRMRTEHKLKIADKLANFA
jgi:hypothetical protein